MTLWHASLASSESVSFFGGWKFTGDFTAVDLLAAATNALNGALLTRRPDHYKNFTRVGIILMALAAGLSGGIVRDVLLGHTPAALTNPAYFTVAVGGAVSGYAVAYAEGQLFREGVFQLRLDDLVHLDFLDDLDADLERGLLRRAHRGNVQVADLGL